MTCWTARLRDVCFIHLGKYGDIILMLPAFQHVAQQIGKPVICMVSQDYSTIFDGVSYVKPWVVPLHWWKGVGSARALALKEGYDPIVVKWWDEPGAKPPVTLNDSGKMITLTIHGERRVLPAEEWDSFQASQWRYAGFTVEQMMEWPVVFDRRDPAREQKLREMYFISSRPQLLVNLAVSGTSPFKSALQARGLVRRGWCDTVFLDRIRATRIFDLLGLYDYAAGLITTDTATLHLASASKVPYIAIINNGGAGSIPKGNCVLTIRYADFEMKRGLFLKTLDQMSQTAIAA